MLKFYKLNDQIVMEAKDGAVELTPNTTDGAYEKHVPIIEHNGDSVVVKVGSVPHPMLDVHWIEWIILETATGIRRKS